MSDEPQSIQDIWPFQAQLNKRAGFDTAGLGAALVKAEREGTLQAEGGIRTEVGRALKNYIDALAAECHELMECLSWKHWYSEAREGRQYELRDIQNARVEVTDMLFFWISICQLLGLAPADIVRLYGKKLSINHRRRDEDRSQTLHAGYEDENLSVT